MRVRLFLGIFLAIFTSFSLVKTEDTVRENYRKAISDAEHIVPLKKLTKSRKTPTLRAFYAMALAFEARESSWVPTKLSRAKEAYAELNQAVKLEPTNFEIRYLRFSFSCEVPSMLNLNEHVQADKQYLLSHIKKGEPLSDIMKGYFKKSSCLNDAEKKRFASGL